MPTIKDAIRPHSGARTLEQGGEVAIAGLRTHLVGVHMAAQSCDTEACELREGYAQGILSGRGSWSDLKRCASSAPRKIPRDSPAALPRAQKKLLRSARRLMFWIVSLR